MARAGLFWRSLGGTIGVVTGETDPLETIEFGRFTVVRHRRELLVDGRATEVGGRAFDALLALIDAGGAVVTKDELMSRVWPDRVVEENNLHGQISELRKVFGAERDLIRMVAGRGYQFTGKLRVVPDVPASSPVSNLPHRTSELIGRDTSLAEVVGLVRAHRLVSLIGPGGIGKTRLGIEAARELVPEFADGVGLAELGPLTDPGLVPMTVAAALAVTSSTGALSVERLAAALGARCVLLVLDNCEHLIEAAARLAEALLRASPTTCVIATSREPLRAAGEYLYRVPPLDVPTEDNIDVEDILRHGAVKLFVTRARAVEPRYVSEMHTEPGTVAALCRRLDGIPLAIELAAARIAAFGVEGVAARLDDRFRILTGGLRTALPHQQTLRATIDWSYELLPASERLVLRRLGVFVGGFTLEAAREVAAGAGLLPDAVLDALANLVPKSLVSADLVGARTVYRLLETTRAYALEKLAESAEIDALARRHAEYYRDLFARAETEWQTRPTVDWLAAYGRELDNVRAALDWAFSPHGDPLVGVALTTSAAPLWFQLSLVDECRSRVERALAVCEPASGPGVRHDMQLHAALGWSLMYTRSPTRETGAAWRKVLELAERLDDADYQLRALWGLWAGNMNNAQFAAAREFGERFCSLSAATADEADRMVGVRLVGTCLHFMGDQSAAREHMERVLDRYVTPVRRSHVVRFQFEQRVQTWSTLARVLWLQGFSEQAMRTVEDNIERAQSMNHMLSLCNALAQAACPAPPRSLSAPERPAGRGLADGRHRRRGLLPTLARLRSSTWGAVVGAPWCDEPGAALAGAGPRARCP